MAMGFSFFPGKIVRELFFKNSENCIKIEYEHGQTRSIAIQLYSIYIQLFNVTRLELALHE